MKALVIADIAPDRPIRDMLRQNPDVEIIITLWDLTYEQLHELGKIDWLPKIGVYGNHCDGRYMDRLGIENVHLKKTQYKWLVFFGYQGCVKHGTYNPVMSTQEECYAAMESAPKVDVLVLHCPPRGINDNSDWFHVWFDGLRKYVEEKAPHFVLHGHTYDFWKFVTKFWESQIRYVYGWNVLDFWAGRQTSKLKLFFKRIAFEFRWNLKIRHLR